MGAKILVLDENFQFMQVFNVNCFLTIFKYLGSSLKIPVFLEENFQALQVFNVKRCGEKVERCISEL